MKSCSLFTKINGMNRALLFCFTFLLVTQSFVAQNILKGKIDADIFNIGEVFITNTYTNAKTIVSSNRNFSIEAKPNHSLVFSGPNISKKTINLKLIDFNTEVFTVKLYPKINQLEEVTINNYPEINAVSLGIISKNVKKYTPAERRLISESSGIGITQLLNAINGRTAELKKNVEVEKKQKMLEEIANMYPEDFYTHNLNIPKNYISGFYLFIIDDAEIMRSIKNKNTVKTEFLLTQLAKKYNKTTENDKK